MQPCWWPQHILPWEEMKKMGGRKSAELTHINYTEILKQCLAAVSPVGWDADTVDDVEVGEANQDGCNDRRQQTSLRMKAIHFFRAMSTLATTPSPIIPMRLAPKKRGLSTSKTTGRRSLRWVRSSTRRRSRGSRCSRSTLTRWRTARPGSGKARTGGGTSCASDHQR